VAAIGAGLAGLGEMIADVPLQYGMHGWASTAKSGAIITATRPVHPGIEGRSGSPVQTKLLGVKVAPARAPPRRPGMLTAR
jgi:hypothetical protein